MKLENQVAIVTGGSRGIGRAVCLELARRGAHVVLCYAGNTDAAQATASDCEALGVQALAVQASVSDETAVQALVNQTLERFGRVDILVNSAGITRDGLTMRMSQADFDAVVDTNLKGTFLTMKAVTRPMMKLTLWPHRKPELRGRPAGKCRAGELRRQQGRGHRYDQISGPGAGQPGHYGQCRSPPASSAQI